MKIYEGPKWIDWETRDAACWLAAKTGLTREAAKHAIIHPNVDPALPHGVTRWLDLVFDTLPQLAAPGVVEEDAPLMAWWRRWAAEGGSRHA